MAAPHNLLERRDGQMRLSHAARAHQQQALFDFRSVNSSAKRRTISFACARLRFQVSSCSREALLDIRVGLKIVEIAVTVALRNARPRKPAFAAILRGAIARNGPNHLDCSGFPRRQRKQPARLPPRLPQRLRAHRRSLHNLPAAAFANRTIGSRHVGKNKPRSRSGKRTRGVQIPRLWKSGVEITAGITSAEFAKRDISRTSGGGRRHTRLTGRQRSGALSSRHFFHANRVARNRAHDGVARGARIGSVEIARHLGCARIS